MATEKKYEHTSSCVGKSLGAVQKENRVDFDKMPPPIAAYGGVDFTKKENEASKEETPKEATPKKIEKKMEDTAVGAIQDDVEQSKVVTSIDQIIPESKLKEIHDKVDEFHKIWYPLQGTVAWMGHELLKNPLDLWIYQEILWECRPDLIIESGTFKGGSALFLANMCDIMQHGQVLSIDINRIPTFPFHQRISYLTGSSVSEEVVKIVDGFCSSVRKVMVILDSDHTKQHVLDELHIYSHFVTPQQYMIVEDSNIHGHPVRDDLPAGPYEAITKFLTEEDNAERFISDSMCERFLMTFNPKGYLRRIK